MNPKWTPLSGKEHPTKCQALVIGDLSLSERKKTGPEAGLPLGVAEDQTDTGAEICGCGS